MDAGAGVNHREVRDRLAEQLLSQPGWAQHSEHDHHFIHVFTGVHVIVYPTEITVLFGAVEGQRYDKAVGASTRYHPSISIISVLEVAAALVTARQIARPPGPANRG
jgi:hypothetical protein